MATHIQRIAIEIGLEVRVTSPDLSRLPHPPGHGVADKLAAVASLGVGNYDLIAVHRDANSAGKDARRDEIREAVDRFMPGTPHISIVPVRMTEAWLLLSERLIREVAGNPNGRVALVLPTAHQVEGIGNPKAQLQETLLAASETSGRRRATARRRFSQQRHQLLERLDPSGPVSHVPSWRRFDEDVRAALTALTR